MCVQDYAKCLSGWRQEKKRLAPYLPQVSQRLLLQMGVCRAAVFIGARDFSPSSLEFSGLKSTMNLKYR